MNAIKYFAFLLFVAAASASVMEHEENLIDGWGKVRETCRTECGLTREQLRTGNTDMQKVKKYLICHGHTTRNLNEDGTINKKVIVKGLEPMCPRTIARPITDCCVDQVYQGKVPNPHEVEVFVANFVTCFKNMLPKSMWNVIGVLERPFYHRLSKCSKKW